MFTVPDGVSPQIGQLLEVLALTRAITSKGQRSELTLGTIKTARLQATDDVARHWNVDVTTVRDKYTRKLWGLCGTTFSGADRFDWAIHDWLVDGIDGVLKPTLHASVPTWHRRADTKAIDDFFSDARQVDHQAAVRDEGDNATTLDDIVPDGDTDGDTMSRLLRLSNAMAVLPPRRVERIVEQTIRRDPDTSLVRTLKELCQYRCQFPECDAVIPMRTGGYYVEVAHIKAVEKGGRSVLGNLLVLCPNHHKEFDVGARFVEEQSVERVSGILNGRRFEIRLPG